MKKNLALTLILVFLCTLLQAQMPKYISITGDWHKGDVMTYSVEKSTKMDGKKYSSHYTMVLEVVDSTETNYRIKATYKGKMIDDENIIPSSLQKLIKDINADLNVEQTVYYLTDQVGSFLEIENWQEVLDDNIEMVDQLLKKIEVEEETHQRTMELVKSLYGKEQVAGKLCAEIPLMHTYIGYVVQTKPKKFENQFSTQFGFIGGKGVLAVTDYNPDTEFCRLESTTTVDPKQLKKVVSQVFSTMALNGGATVSKKEIKSLKMDMSDRQIWEYQAIPGIPLHVEYTRTVNAIDSHSQSLQEDRYVIKKID